MFVDRGLNGLNGLKKKLEKGALIEYCKDANSYSLHGSPAAGEARRLSVTARRDDDSNTALYLL